jgi:hypothetical protein
MDREAQFLEARAQRQQQANYASCRERSEELRVFWTVFRQEIRQWQDRLKEVVTVEDPPKSLTERRTQLRISLAELQAQLDSLRKHCLSTDTLTATTTTTTTTTNTRLDWDVPDDIPAADLRLLHTELTQCATALEEAKEKHLPKAKFVFHRYRKAIMEQQQRLEAGGEPTPQQRVVDVSESIQVSSTKETKSDNPLENISNVSIRVDMGGKVEMKSTKNETAGDVLVCSSLPTNQLSAPVLQNVQHSHVSVG